LSRCRWCCWSPTCASSTLEWARLAVATAAWPLQRVTGIPIDAAGDFGTYLSRQTTLIKENEDLRRRQLGTANLLLRQDHLEQENKRLRALLDMRERQPVEGRIAEILYAARDPFLAPCDHRQGQPARRRRRPSRGR
jgi:rod shape-determining protein MreC